MGGRQNSQPAAPAPSQMASLAPALTPPHTPGLTPAVSIPVNCQARVWLENADGSALSSTTNTPSLSPVSTLPFSRRLTGAGEGDSGQVERGRLAAASVSFTS